MKKFIVMVSLLALSACASTTVTPISKNSFILDTSAAPACGRSGAAKVAAKMAAVETIRAGYDGFIIQGMQSANNVQIVNTAPTGATTNSTYNVYGNNVYGQSHTTFTGGGPIAFGSHDQRLAVVMLKKGEPGFSKAVDARVFLGENWQSLAEKGVSTCSAA